MRARLGAWLFARLTQLERPWLGGLVLAAALLLVSPSLFSGFALDDFLFLYQTSRLSNSEWPGGPPFDLFRWVDAAHLPRLMDGQGLPWWTFDGTTVAFMRPVSSLSHSLDHWLWPHSAFGMHVQSVLWFACLLLLAARTYAALGESRFVTALSSAMFALDSAHGVAVGWISNRNALLGGVFGIAALLCHHRSRIGLGRASAALAWGCFALALFSIEAGIGSAGYLAAYAFCFEACSLRRRLSSLLPYAAIAGGWFAIRHANYAVVGLGGYLDPLQEPLAFLHMLPQRTLVLIGSQVARFGADWFDWVPVRQQPLVLACALICCALALWVAWPGLRSDRRTRFWACGALFSALPLTAAVPSDRLLMLVGLGVMPTLARAMRDALQPAGTPRRKLAAWRAWLRRDVAVGLAFIHLVVDPLLLPLFALAPSIIAKTTYALENNLPSGPTLRQQTVIVAAIPASWMVSYLPVMRSVHGKPRPNKLHWLLSTEQVSITQPAVFERRGANQLRVTFLQGFIDDHWFERNSLQPLHRGDRVQLSEMTVTVVEVTQDGRPTVCDFDFARPLESSSYVWLTWHEGRLERFQLPSNGRRTILPSTSRASGLPVPEGPALMGHVLTARAADRHALLDKFDLAGLPPLAVQTASPAGSGDRR